FIGEVHVARCVDQVELVLLAVAGNVGHADRVELDGDPALALQVQGIQNLSLHLPLLQHAGCLDQPIGERRLAVVDVRDNAEVANMIELQVGSFGLCWRQRRDSRNITAAGRSPPAKKKKKGRSTRPSFLFALDWATAGSVVLVEVARLCSATTRLLAATTRLLAATTKVVARRAASWPEADRARGRAAATELAAPDGTRAATGRLMLPQSAVSRSRCARSASVPARSEEHTSELQSRQYLVCRLLLEKKKKAPLVAIRVDVIMVIEIHMA